jgi:pimeloyl-ACP methyl ester carboxylesterase
MKEAFSKYFLGTECSAFCHFDTTTLRPISVLLQLKSFFRYIWSRSSSLRGVPLLKDMDRQETEPLKELINASDENDDVFLQENNHCPPKSLWQKLKLPSWKPTSDEELRLAEAKMLSGVVGKYKQALVKITDDQYINTIKMGSGPTLVLLHGFGGGLGMWACNLDDLSQYYTVYAIDLLGFGRSSRPPFEGKTADDGENYFLNSFEEWRKRMKLEKFALFGHSFGAYLSATYALQNPHRVERLILCDPWGVPEKPREVSTSNAPLKWRLLRKLVFKITLNPVDIVRLAGPWGPSLVTRFRSDLVAKFSHLYNDNTVINYVYHCLAQNPSGEKAFFACTEPIAWAKKPLCKSLPNLSENIPSLFIYGEDSWMDPNAGFEVSRKLRGPTEFVILPGDHHVYCESYELMNKIVKLFGQGKLKDYLNPKIDL